MGEAVRVIRHEFRNNTRNVVEIATCAVVMMVAIAVAISPVLEFGFRFMISHIPGWR